MATYAVMHNDTVVNIVIADDKDEAEQALNVTLIGYTPDNPAGIGYTYDELTGTFLPPVE